jgi:hypothetical protein
MVEGCTPSRPFGQKTNLLSQHHQGFGIVTWGLPRVWWGSSKRLNSSKLLKQSVCFPHK